MKKLRISLLLIIGVLISFAVVYRDDIGELRQRFLLSAAARGDISEMKLALFLGADVNAAQEGLNALSSAAYSSSPESVKFLLERGAMVNSPISHGMPLSAVASFNHLETGKVLIAAGEDVNAKNGIESPIVIAARSGAVQVAELFINSGADLNRDGEQAMKNAIIAGHSEIVRLLIERGINVQNMPSEKDSTLFDYANHTIRKENKEEIIKLLKQARARE